VPALAPGASAKRSLQLVDWPNAATTISWSAISPLLVGLPSGLANRDLPWSIKKQDLGLQVTRRRRFVEITMRAW